MLLICLRLDCEGATSFCERGGALCGGAGGHNYQGCWGSWLCLAGRLGSFWLDVRVEREVWKDGGLER